MAENDELERIKKKMVEQLTRAEDRGIWTDGRVIELNEANFDEALGKATVPVLVDFWAGWCAPCRVMKPVMEALAKEFAGRAGFGKIDVDQNQALARRYGVMSIPNFVLFKNGKPVDRAVGAVGRRGLETMLRRHLTSAGE